VRETLKRVDDRIKKHSSTGKHVNKGSSVMKRVRDRIEATARQGTAPTVHFTTR
jgi:hypothetical protein